MNIPQDMILNSVEHKYAGNYWAVVETFPDEEWSRVVNIGKDINQFYLVWSKLIKPENAAMPPKLLEKVNQIRADLASGKMVIKEHATGEGMKIRDSHATINGDKTEFEMPSGGLDVIGQDGRSLFSVSLEKDGSLRVNATGHCRHGGIVYEDCIVVAPKSSNVIEVRRLECDLLK